MEFRYSVRDPSTGTFIEVAEPDPSEYDAGSGTLEPTPCPGHPMVLPPDVHTVHYAEDGSVRFYSGDEEAP